MDKPNVLDREYILKLNEISGKLLYAVETGTDPREYEGMVEAQVMNAIQYGFDLAKGGK